jgi:hypothetical protein
MSRDDLPKGHARLVTREDGVTIVIQGDAEEVRRQFNEHLDETLGTDGETIKEYLHPEFEEGLVSAEEFYSDNN